MWEGDSESDSHLVELGFSGTGHIGQSHTGARRVDGILRTHTFERTLGLMAAVEPQADDDGNDDGGHDGDDNAHKCIITQFLCGTRRKRGAPATSIAISTLRG